MSDPSPPPRRTPIPTITPDTALSTSLSTQSQQYEDCTPCRLMGSAAFTGLGAYTYYSGRKQLKEREVEILRSGSRFGLAGRRMAVLGMSLGLVGVGAWRLID